MMKFLRRLHINVFTVLMALAAVAFMFRAVNLATQGEDKPVSAILSATAQEQVNEQPPPLSREELESAVRETARAVDAPATEGPAGIQPPAGEPIRDPMAIESRGFSSAEIEVLQSLAKRRDELEKREAALSQREALLSAAEQEVDRKVAELNQLREELEKLLGTQQNMQEDRIASLVKIYESMKPKEAAAIFNTLDMDVLLAVIGRMNERKSSPILASMNPDKARIVTIRLAEQRKLPDGADR